MRSLIYISLIFSPRPESPLNIQAMSGAVGLREELIGSERPAARLGGNLQLASPYTENSFRIASGGMEIARLQYSISSFY